MTIDERTEMLVERYGECCTRTTAARVLGRSVNTVKAMIRDGRLEEVCEGTMVDVRSIARYIQSPKRADFEARKERYKTRRKTNWVV